MREYADVKYVECDNVYPPAEDTFLLIDNLDVKKEDHVLEIGVGSGIVSIYASRKCSKVVGVDVNPYAIECTKKNITLNDIKNIEVFESDLFSSINECFDLIIFNTPYLPVEDDEHVDDDYSKAWNGGVDGREVIDCFLDNVSDYLNDNGRVELVQSSFSDNDKTLDILRKKGFDAKITDSIHLFFEDITLISAVKN